MMDLEKLEVFLSSLFPISQTHYQIWGNDQEMLFSTEGVMSQEPLLKECQYLSRLIRKQNGFKYRDYDGNSFLCGVPLEISQEVSGALLAYGRTPCRFSRPKEVKAAEADHHKEMELFLSNLKLFVDENLTAKQEVKELIGELDRSFEDLYLYGKISTQIKTLKYSDIRLKNLLKEILENMRVDLAFAWFADKPAYSLQIVNTQISDKFAGSESWFENLVQTIHTGETIGDRNYLIVKDSRENAQYRVLAVDPYRFLAIKVQHNGHLFGWLGMVSFNLNEIFRHSELNLLTSLAEQIGAIMANTELYENLEQFVINMVKSLVFAIEAKDRYTRGHSERVSKYSLLIGKRLGLSNKEYNDLRWASVLHDIGKIGIPEYILNKPTRLLDAEFEIIRGHPLKGGQILKPIEQLADSLPGIMHHHERYDGRGYPQGLKGEEIPLIARIIAVADTFDAISSVRAYRKERSTEEALEIIEGVAGTQLDARIVDVFKKVYQEDLRFEKEEKKCPTVQNTMPLAKWAAPKQGVALS
jgi:HD-GYP domain-containing protein (c-di-GMP phosphodiesterase class II)